MISYGSGSKSESYNVPSYPMGAVKTRDTSQQLFNKIWPMISRGDMGDPLVKTLYNLARGQATSQEGQEMAGVAGARGLSPVAKEAALTNIAGKAVTGAAGVAPQVWQQLLAMLNNLLQPAGSLGGASSKGGESGGVSVNPSWFQKA